MSRVSKSIKKQIYIDRAAKRRRIQEFLEKACKEYDEQYEAHLEYMRDYARRNKERVKQMKAQWYKRKKEGTFRTGRESSTKSSNSTTQNE